MNIKESENLESIKRFPSFFGTAKVFLRAGIILALFLFIYITAHAGLEKYPSDYAVDSIMESPAEINTDSEIKIVFNQPVIFLNSENIKITPLAELNFNLSGDNKILILKPKNSFSNETKYELEFINIRGLSGLVMDNKKFIFFTKTRGDKEINIELEKTLSFTEFNLSKDRYSPPETSKPKTDIEIEPKFTEGKYIDISITNQVMTLFENGIKVNSFLISSGKRGYPTPLGTFSVKRKEDNHWSSVYGLWMPYSMNFIGAFYIHELPYWTGGYREGENHLGIRVSHGCVRLGIGPAKYVYDWSEIGTPIYIHN